MLARAVGSPTGTTTGAATGTTTGADPVEDLARAREIVAGNPIATAIVDRAEALASGDAGRLPAIAAALAPRSRYQQARTLVLAGGDAAAEGRSLLATLPATPMA